MKKLLALSLALLMTASLAACGSKAETAPSSSAASSEAASSEAASSEAPDATSETPNIDRIKAAGKIVMCTNLAFPPFEYVGADGKAAGVDIDISQAIADDLGVQLEVVDMNFDLLIDSVKAGKADFSAAGMTIKPERLEQIDFSDEYVKSAQYIIIKKDSGVTADKLDGLTIAVQESTTGDFYATDEIKAKEVLRFKSGIEAGAALSAGKCDAVIIDKLPAESIAANSNGVLEVLPDSLTEESYAIAVKKDSPDLLAEINKVLKKLVDEGKVDELVTKHMTEAK
ncbi:ABC transporter substrate-binding protein [Marasmitruncus massiliensis]|uniref:ABC transporter substrate-binding protein n=1 Tax=Marasmitruncus massiliensis TaxID=1944642 RepID=UPI000C7AC663|nr:ABC transporter substrate-binding protein [Marasmitruncus massiliensis]